jgi:electron transfer flavoprotein alpha subunit
MSVLVVIEHDRGVLADASLEALAFAADIAAQLGVEVGALGVGAASSELADVCGAHGASVFHLAPTPGVDEYSPLAWGAVIAAAAGELAPSAIVATGTDRGNEVLAFAAAELDLPFVANCLTVTTGDDWEMTRVQWGGSLNEEARLTSPLPILSVAPHAVEAAEPDAGGSVSVQTLDVAVPESAVATMIQDRVVLSEGVTLATAPVVVGGGRGVGSAEGFEVLEALAAKLGGVVGCSRAVTNNGWRPHSDQVGQTGTRIAPQLYIACGISGAIQHWVGAKAAKTILAINTDPAANMVVRADYAVIGDLFEVLPAITDAS